MNISTKTLHISLPESLMESAKREEEKLEQVLLEGVRSGRGIEVGSKEWKEFRKELSTGAHTKQLKPQV